MSYRESKVEASSSPPASAWLMGAAAWAVPGVGHFLQGRWARGLIVGGTVLGMFALGLLFGGHLFGLGGKEEGFSRLLQLPPMIANLGSGFLYFICWAGNIGFTDTEEYARLATYEYGNTFLLVAGLLNYLAMLDAFDIAAGRKS